MLSLCTSRLHWLVSPPSSPLRPPGARPTASSVNLTPDVHGIVGGKLPGHSISSKHALNFSSGSESIRKYGTLLRVQWHFFLLFCSRWINPSCPTSCLSQCDAFPLIKCLSESSPPVGLRGDHFH